MQPKAQDTTRGILAVSAGVLEVLLQHIRRFRSGPTLTSTMITIKAVIRRGAVTSTLTFAP